MSDQLEYPFAVAPEPGELLEVSPGIHWLRMPLPFMLDHINLWLLEDGEGWTLVDTGIGSDSVKQIWEALLAGPLQGRPIKRIIVTHFHPDHLGLAGWLSRRFDAPVLMTQLEFELATLLHGASGDDRSQRQRDFFTEHGLTQQAAEQLDSGDNVYRTRVPELPSRYQRVRHHEVLSIGEQRWQVVVGAGHSPEHLSLYCEALDLLIAGDQMLPRISPHIGVSFLNPQADPLTDYLSSLELLQTLPSSVRVLPAHGLVFDGLHQRVAELQRHHQQRLSLLLAECQQPQCGADVLKVLFDRKFGPHELFFAMGEAIAHLHHLLANGLVQQQKDSQGVMRFLRVNS
ncbi:MAG: MBL fold metallo-hydrolase [Halopseudomonas sp.]